MPTDAATIMGVIDKAIAEATASGGDHVEFVLLRHGRPAEHDPATPDPSLGLLGRRQAEAAARYLAREPVEAVYSSALARAHDTARIVGDALRRTVRVLPDLREITVYRDDLAHEVAWRAAAARFAEQGRWDAFPLHRDERGLRARVCDAMEEIALHHATGPIVVSCHNGVINAVLADLLGLERDYFVRPAHASFTRIRHRAGRWTLHTVNETGHLDPELVTS
ncbi:MAG TPA: histidine phosphatase family protein [Pseudonocardiaceae bacterium]|jgi:broad specificity phosphatase PhoE|nr:histidine phosphatase family protein [Pseudonocardiaceae bacterium]